MVQNLVGTDKERNRGNDKVINSYVPTCVLTKWYFLYQGGRIDSAHHDNTPFKALNDTLAFQVVVPYYVPIHVIITLLQL